MSAKETRNSIGADIIVAMVASEEFPISNRHRLGKTMQEYFVSEGFEDELIHLGYKWRPSADYWTSHLNEIRGYLRKKKKLFLEYKRANDDGTFNGMWEFVKKGDFRLIMSKENTGMATRAETYNERVSDGRDKWKNLDTPSVRLAMIETDE